MLRRFFFAMQRYSVDELKKFQNRVLDVVAVDVTFSIYTFLSVVYLIPELRGGLTYSFLPSRCIKI